MDIERQRRTKSKVHFLEIVDRFIYVNKSKDYYNLDPLWRSEFSIISLDQEYNLTIQLDWLARLTVKQISGG